MKTYKPLFRQLVIVFLLLSFFCIILLYWQSPHKGLRLQLVSPSLLLREGLIYICLFLILLYFIVKRFSTALQTETERKDEIINRYDALNAATNDAVWDYNLLTGETFYNNRLVGLFGYTKTELKNNTNWWADNIHPEDKQRVENKISGILKNDDITWEDEYRFRCKNGAYKTVHDRSYIVRNKKGEATRLIGAMQDITEMKKLQHDFLNQQLENKNQMAKAILLAHEEERKKIKEELHEDVNQLLASAKLHVAHLAPGNGKVINMQAQQHLGEAINKIRKIANQLAPSGIEYFGLVPSLTDLFSEAKKNLPLVDFTLHNELFEEDKLDNNLRIMIYRVVQDILGCIFQQRDVSYIEISLNNHRQPLSLQFYFNGNISNNKLRDENMARLKHKLEPYNGSLHIREMKNDRNRVEVLL